MSSSLSQITLLPVNSFPWSSMAAKGSNTITSAPCPAIHSEHLLELAPHPELGFLPLASVLSKKYALSQLRTSHTRAC
ncbi:hypothetical protein [Vibrio genomosp. F10]|uniref:hypothetical protein n=1 Tax=Vibrio genomosp. F10 TaxID=723171 RepID=UPI0018E941B9|nr:hypothetical protein [Vibrio genomosp. F10]